MNRMLRITTFLVALVVLAIAAPLAQADPWQLEQDNPAAVARDGHLPSNGASQAPASDIGNGWQGKYIVGGEVVTAGQQDANPLPNVNIVSDEPVAADPWQTQFTGATNYHQLHPDNQTRFTPDAIAQPSGIQTPSDISWNDVGFGFGAGLLLAVLVGGAVVMSGRARRGGLAHS